MTLELDIDDTLKFDNDGNLCLNINPDSQNVSIKDDGLYVAANPGKDVPGGSGYPSSYGPYDAEGLRFGAKTPFGNNQNPDISAPLMFTCTNIIHRVFTSRTEDGSDIVDFRESIDCTLAGDMYKVAQENGKYKYFLIVETVIDNRTIRHGNRIARSVFLGEW